MVIKNRHNSKSTSAATPTAPAHKSPYSVSTGGMTRGMVSIEDTRNDAPKMPTVYYTPEVKAQMDFIVEKCHKEVGWLALAKHYPKLDAFLVYRVMLPSQQVSSSKTDIDGDAMAEIGEELLDDGANTEDMYVWFHSHVNMGVTPSFQDEKQIEEFLESCPIFIRGIVNKKGDEKVDVYFRDHNIAYTCVPTDVYYHFETDPCEGLDALIKDRVKDAPLPYRGGYVPGAHRGYPGHGGYGYQFPTSQPVNNSSSPAARHGNAHNDTVVHPDDYFDKDFGEAQEQLALVDTNKSEGDIDTGYGQDWDEDDPIYLRPSDWYNDSYYWLEGFFEDTYNKESPAYEEAIASVTGNAPASTQGNNA